jgi:hypothetical protein
VGVRGSPGCRVAFVKEDAVPNDGEVVGALAVSCGRKHKEFVEAAAEALERALRGFKGRSHGRRIIPLLEAACARASREVEETSGMFHQRRRVQACEELFSGLALATQL